MIAPRRTIRHRDVEYAIYQKGEAWVIEVEGAAYFLTAGDDPIRQARRFLGKLPRNSLWSHGPATLASEFFPVILSIDGVIVRAWPALVPRDDPPKTFEHDYWNQRVTAVKKDPVWMFATRGRRPTEGGTAHSQQTIDDVTDMAKVWLRSHDDSP